MVLVEWEAEEGWGGGAESVIVNSKQRRANREEGEGGERERSCEFAHDESCHSPSPVGDREDEQEALPCPHVLFSHGSKLFLSSRVED